MDPSTDKTDQIVWKKVDKSATDVFVAPTERSNGRWKRVFVQSKRLLPIPVEHKARHLRPEDDVENGSDVLSTRHKDINTSFTGGNDLPEDLFSTRGHY